MLGRALVPLLRGAGHEVVAPSRRELDLFDAAAVATAVVGAGAVYHLATRIPPPERHGDPRAWAENDRLRREATRILVDAAVAAGSEAFVLPTVAFVYPRGSPADEETPLGDVPAVLESALDAEREVARFASHGRGVVLRLGLLDGPGTGLARPVGGGASLHVDDAGAALLAALAAPSGVYNVTRDGERVSNARFVATTGWRPAR